MGASAGLLSSYFAFLFNVRLPYNFPLRLPASSLAAETAPLLLLSPPLWPESVCSVYPLHFITKLPEFSSCTGDVRYFTSGKVWEKIER